MNARPRQSRSPQRPWALVLALCCACGTAWAKVDLQVVVEGVEGELQENILAFLSINNQKDHPLATESLVERLHQKAPQEIRQALRPFGYYRPQIDSALVKPNGQWIARYTVVPGPPIPIAQLDLQITGPGAEEKEFRDAREQLPLRQGAALRHNEYEESKQTLREIASEHGYLDGRFTEHKIIVDLDVYEARVDLHYETGPRYRFGELIFQQDILREDFVRTFSPFEPGEPYSVSDLLGLQKALSDSGYFRYAEVRPRKEQAVDRKVPIYVNMQPRKPNNYSLGIGYGTDTGARASAGWLRRWVNKRGHRFNLDLFVAEIRNEQTARYTIPLEYFKSEQVAITLARDEEQLRDRESRALRLGISHSQVRGQWREVLALNYRKETYRIGTDQNTATLLMPSADWSRTRANNRIYVTKGSQISVGIRGASDRIISNTSFAQLETSGKLIRQPFDSGRLILRATFGTSVVSKFGELPTSVRFYAGGDRSVRGYSYNSLSPKDAEGNEIGGRHKAVGSVEFEQPIKGKWSAAVFMDAGNAINEFPVDAKRGAGFGVRWRSPIGLVRLDIAWGLDAPGTPWRLHFVIGPDL